MSMTRYLLVILALGVGCAEGTPGSPDPGQTNNETTSPNNVVSTNNQTSPMPDMGPSCGACCPGDVMCVDETTRAVCRTDGTGFNSVPCVGDELCTAGVCRVPPACIAGETSCYDSTTVLTCRQTGDGFTTAPCDAGTSCINGTCLSGSPSGDPCSTDGECASQNCRCGSGTDDSCPNNPASGYCAAPTCDSDSCGRDAVCFAASAAPLNESVDYDHCLAKCTPGSCPGGLACVGVPINGPAGIAWEDACYFGGFVPIGGNCTSNAQCIGGLCLLDYFNSSEPGYCTRRCDEDSSCPSNAACVSLRAGEYHCSLKCGTGSISGTQRCPVDLTGQRFDVQCRVLTTPQGTAVRACAAR